MIEESLADDPLEVALIRVESEQNTCNVDADGYEKMLDSCEIIEKPVAFLIPAKKSRKDCEEMKCKKMLEELNVKFSLMDAIQMIPSMRCLNFTINDKNAALTPQQGMIEEILADDPLEVALIRVESEQNTCNVDANGYE
ncbi:hypothetical protein F2Q69_00038366 [Brassica cretica]|uniref:Uncharacterized protein n=1 Tax=Brassica cretica TaxID=69181 RepID=A0A8S9SUD8_BRACR|nr:hypothetical protein F2Q69_00038366 [Brassica cretica]